MRCGPPRPPGRRPLIYGDDAALACVWLVASVLLFVAACFWGGM